MSVPAIVEKQLAAAEQLVQAQAALAAKDSPTVVEDVSQLTQPPQPAAPEPPPKPAVDWEAKFRSLQGMYNAEVPQLRAQAKTQESQLTLLNEQLRALTEATKQQAAKQPTQTVDPKDIESFGADMIDMVQRYAQQVFDTVGAEVRAIVEKMDARIAALETQVTGVRQTSEQSLEKVFYDTLSRLVPDWQQINEDERWLKWLAESDPVYGVPRQDALTLAHERRDAARAAAVFVEFKKTLPTKPSLASQQAPSSGGAVDPPQPAAVKQVFSSKAVQDFYREVTRGSRGKYAGRPDEVARIEAEINLAAAEGRIV